MTTQYHWTLATHIHLVLYFLSTSCGASNKAAPDAHDASEIDSKSSADVILNACRAEMDNTCTSLNSQYRCSPFIGWKYYTDKGCRNKDLELLFCEALGKGENFLPMAGCYKKIDESGSTIYVTPGLDLKAEGPNFMQCDQITTETVLIAPTCAI